MSKMPMNDELLKITAAKHGVSLAVLVSLLELEEEFGNRTSPSAKGEFSRQVWRILDEGAAQTAV
jgi:hypothetical protein